MIIGFICIIVIIVIIVLIFLYSGDVKLMLFIPSKPKMTTKRDLQKTVVKEKPHHLLTERLTPRA